MVLPKLVFTDIDGVWTDGGMYYDEQGNEWKKFNTSDSAGILFLRRLKIPVCIITGENSKAVLRRSQKLGIEHTILGSKNKLLDAQQLAKSLQIDLLDCAYIGDDVNDLPLLNSVGISGAPCSAATYIQSAVSMITITKGGHGSFREFVERILISSGLSEDWFTLCDDS